MNSVRLAFVPFVIVGLSISPGSVSAQSAGPHCPTSGVDQLLRSCKSAYPDMVLPIPEIGCQAHESDITSLEINGRTYSWDDYSGWGAQLFDLGFADQPPAGPFDPADPARSLRISDYPDYTCSRCHNDRREDPILFDRDPEARFDLIRSQTPDDYRTSPVKMVQGVTMWGAVNRMRFYNGLFSFFDRICVPVETTLYRTPEDPEGRNYQPVDCGGSRFAPCTEGCRKLDTASLADAVQTCGRYCGVGRFLEDWEIQALLTHFWEGQVRLEDVVDSLQNYLAFLERNRTSRAQDIAVVEWKLGALRPLLQSLDATPSVDACQALSDSFLLSSCDSLRDSTPGEKPDNSSCWRDWTVAVAPDRKTPAADLPAMIRHIRTAGQTLKNPPPAATVMPAFVQDDVLPEEEPPTATLSRGKALYELSCGRCHGATAMTDSHRWGAAAMASWRGRSMCFSK